MLRAGSLLPYLLLALSIVDALGHPATPEKPGRLRLPLKARDTMSNIVKRDRLARRNARSDDLRKRQDPPDVPPTILPPLTNILDGFTAQVGIGSPATEYTLLVDLMHPNTWIGAGQAYQRTSTSVNTGQQVNVSYTEGEFTGAQYTDTVTVAPNLTITAQAIDVAPFSFGFYGIDGALGLAPAQGYDAPPGTPTVLDTLESQGLITAKVFGLTFIPASYPDSMGTGELTVGGTDTTQYTVWPHAALTLINPPWDAAWGITVSIVYADTRIGFFQETYLDMTNMFISLPTPIFNRYVNMTGAVYDEATGMLKIETEDFPNLQPLYITWNGLEGNYALIPDAQIWPAWLNDDIGGDSEHFYIPVIDAGNGSTMSLGLPFLNRYYIEYDLDNSLAGVAPTAFTNMIVNSVLPS